MHPMTYPLMPLSKKGGYTSLMADFQAAMKAVVIEHAEEIAAFAQDLRISIPKRTKATPVQQYNRDGVKAVEAHNYDKAKKLFYKAYLLDPNDPFTLNNLGYMAELDGDLDRAQRYYGLAADLSSDAMVDKATDDQVEGKAVIVASQG